MKRSEMLELISKLLDAGIDDFPKADRAENLLCHLEQCCMLPPGHMKPLPFENGKQYPLVPGDFLNDEGIWCTPGINEWEPE